MKRIFLLIVAIFLVLGALIISLRLLSGEDNWICVNNQWVKHGNPSAPMPTSGCGEKTTSPTTTPSATSVPQSESGPTEQQIAEALAVKNNWDVSNIVVKITTTEGDYAKGLVNFKNEGGGGLWFAAKVNGEWKIVFDGNGIITCESLVDYPNFPATLIPQCFDQKTNNPVTR